MTITPTAYPCLVVHPGGSCRITASYFAIDNRARYGHVCRICWREMTTNERELYALHEGTNNEPRSH